MTRHKGTTSYLSVAQGKEQNSHSPVLSQLCAQEQFVVYSKEYSTFAALLYSSSEKTSRPQ